MKHKKLLVGLAMALACNGLTLAQVARTAANRCQELKDFRIVAERPARRGKQVLAVDQDSRVLLLQLSESGHITETEPLGYEEAAPASFPYASLVPKDEVIATLRRVSCANEHWRVWVALTIGFDSAESRPRGTAPLSNRLLVFRDPVAANGKPILLDESFREILELTVDDINDDERTEIAAQYSSADEGAWMKIWQIAENGELRSIPLDNIKKDLNAAPGHVEVGLGDYRHGGELLFTEQRLQTAKGWHVTRRFYDWDDAKKRYQLAEVVQSDEITLK